MVEHTFSKVTKVVKGTTLLEAITIQVGPMGALVKDAVDDVVKIAADDVVARKKDACFLSEVKADEVYGQQEEMSWTPRMSTNSDFAKIVVVGTSRARLEQIEANIHWQDEVYGITDESTVMLCVTPLADSVQFLQANLHHIMAIVLVGPKGHEGLCAFRGQARLLSQPVDICSVEARNDYFDELETIKTSVAVRESTPFLDSLLNYRDKGVKSFHTLPITTTCHPRLRELLGQSQQAETSSTAAPLDSLFHPTGSIKAAQMLAARAFGAHASYFCTDGTSCANRVVMHTLVSKQDIVLVDQSCHKSIHQSCVLTGCQCIYLRNYDIPVYKLNGIVPLHHVTQTLERLREAKLLHRVRLLVLTNCTFDGMCYNPYKVMKECLDIHPDLVFHWDEAWFASARFSEILGRRTAMASAQRLQDEYRQSGSSIAVRAWCTHSTHKSLSAVRQGSMIHRFDDTFTAREEAHFHEMFANFTTTSPHSTIIASLDAARLQCESDVLRLHSNAVAQSQRLRMRLQFDPELSRMYKVLGPEDLIPEGMRHPSGSGVDERSFAEVVEEDECVLDPTRVCFGWYFDMQSLDMKRALQALGIQINRVSFSCALLTCTLAVTQEAVDAAVSALKQICIDAVRIPVPKPMRCTLRVRTVESGQSIFSVPTVPSGVSVAHATRHSVIAAYNEVVQGVLDQNEFVDALLPVHYKFQGPLPHIICMQQAKNGFGLRPSLWQGKHMQLAELAKACENKEVVVCGSFVIPYPPGCPIMVPGQLVQKRVVLMLKLLMEEGVEIHGYLDDVGIKVWVHAMKFDLRKVFSVTMFPAISACTMAATRFLLRVFSQMELDHSSPRSEESKISETWMELSLTYLFSSVLCLLAAFKFEPDVFAHASRSKLFQVQHCVFGTIGVIATFCFIRSTVICGPAVAVVFAQSKLLLDPLLDILVTGTWLEMIQTAALPVIVCGMACFVYDLAEENSSSSASSMAVLLWGLSYPVAGSFCWAFGRACVSSNSNAHFTSAFWFFFYHLVIALCVWLTTGSAHLNEHMQSINKAISMGVVLCFYEISLMMASMRASPVATTVANSGMISVLYVVECIIGWQSLDVVKVLGSLTCVFAALIFNLSRRAVTFDPPITNGGKADVPVRQNSKFGFDTHFLQSIPKHNFETRVQI